MSQIQAVLKSDVGNGNTIRQTMRDLNKQLETNASTGYFATLFYGIADRSTGRLEFANAGHDFPILVRRNGEVTVLKSTGPALGVVSDLDYGTESVEIREGDYVLLYTDGITETMASNGKEYGALRLRDILISNRHRDPKEIVQIIKNDLRTFSPGGTPDDDRTLILLRVNTVGR
jgi:serine phosphatase RsbU (regulator of sigma subunit)